MSNLKFEHAAVCIGRFPTSPELWLFDFFRILRTVFRQTKVILLVISKRASRAVICFYELETHYSTNPSFF